MNSKIIFAVGGLLSLLFLISLFVPVGTGRISKIEHQKLRNRNSMKALEIAINGYQVEYNLPPGALQSPSSETTPARSQGPLIQSLMAQNKIDNPRNIIFFEPNIRKGNSSGLIPDHQPASFVDSWGQPYYILVDSDADQQIPNPDPSPKKSSPVLNSKTIIYSSGPDQDPLTWDDNITSWE